MEHLFHTPLNSICFRQEAVSDTTKSNEQNKTTKIKLNQTMFVTNKKNLSWPLIEIESCKIE